MFQGQVCQDGPLLPLAPFVDCRGSLVGLLKASFLNEGKERVQISMRVLVICWKLLIPETCFSDVCFY